MISATLFFLLCAFGVILTILVFLCIECEQKPPFWFYVLTALTLWFSYLQLTHENPKQIEKFTVEVRDHRAYIFNEGYQRVSDYNFSDGETIWRYKGYWYLGMYWFDSEWKFEADLTKEEKND